MLRTATNGFMVKDPDAFRAFTEKLTAEDGSRVTVKQDGNAFALYTEGGPPEVPGASYGYGEAIMGIQAALDAGSACILAEDVGCGTARYLTIITGDDICYVDMQAVNSTAGRPGGTGLRFLEELQAYP